MILDFQFILYSSILIGCLIPLYLYRKKIFKYNKENGDFNLFVKDLRVYLSNNHPKINFDFSIIDKTALEHNLKVRETQIVEDILKQFFDFKYEKLTQKSVDKDKLWVGYDQNSISSLKTPSDWKQRKDLAWLRDDQRCNRCGNKILLKNSYTQFAKEIENGGGYNFENIITLCLDCNNVLKSQNTLNTINALEIHDKLMLLVKA